ncbi:MAG: hypothetical protein J0J06_01745 [Sphingomonas sp.]|uniref:hypothetical protein n=1 Tax=Sphingomonas sp. TaxID=28214 RepID=UPI001ACBB853|nr:hypothetical protein [Sphingomonas sp.]MBN8814153.1 hypothetical protein [Sphingomonas sp.]
MHPHSSSTSSSEADAPRERRRRWATLLWALLWLIVLDVGASLAFAFPADVKNVNPGKLQLFFDYGRSMEARVRRMTRADPNQTAPITLAGWYSPLKAVERPAQPGAVPITVYGMSHAVRLADALHSEFPNYAVRTVAGPGATTNWSFGAFRRDTGNRASKVVVLAIMSSTLPEITSMTPMTWNVSFPLAYTQDRYFIDGAGKLQVVTPPYESFADYTATLNDPQKWAAAVAKFQRYDPFYDPLMFRATPLDHSTLVRLARRAWINKRDRETASDVLTAKSFNPDSEAVKVANAIIAEFAATARRNGQLPVIYIVNNYGYGNQLFRALRMTIQRDRIPYLSSDTVVDPNNPANYLPDTHFTDENDRRLAQALDRVIADNLAR